MDWQLTYSRNNKGKNSTFSLISTNLEIMTTQNDSPLFYIEGYFVPRLLSSTDYSQGSLQLLQDLYAKYKLDFVQHIKGAFTIILFVDNEFHVFSDRHNLSKYFVFKDDSQFIISNNIKLIAQTTRLHLSPDKTALFTLLKRFPAGYTLFEKIESSQPATILSIMKNGQLIQRKYWTPETLFRKKQKQKSYKELAKDWKEIIKGYITFLNPKKCCITLTGGNDSRMVLAGLLSNKIKPLSFTYGNPESSDGVIAAKIAGHVELDHNNHFACTPTVSWFSSYANQIIEKGNTLVNIHRAHRLDAIIKQKRSHPDMEMLFTGLVGGEYIKEPEINNITIPEIIWLFAHCNDKEQKVTELKTRLEVAGVDINCINIERVYDWLQTLAALGNGFTVKQKKFIYTYHFYAVAHHTQDPIVFSTQIPWVVNPFMDIDFLEMLSVSKSWYVNKKGLLTDKLWHSYFLVRITDILHNPLSSVSFAKKGSYSGNDMLRHPFIYLLKRARYFLPLKPKKYPQNFPMGNWLYDYCKGEIINLHPEIKSIYKASFLEKKLEEVKEFTTEERWHIVTNPINVSLNLHYYGKS